MRVGTVTKTASALLILIVLLNFCACTQNKPGAVLHNEGDVGYISCIADMKNVDISSEQAFIYELDSDSFIYLKGEGLVVYPASTLKLLTALYALSLMPADTLITAGDEIEMIAKDSSVAYIKKGHVLTLEMLIQGMMIPSGNDAAYVVAAAVGRLILGDEAAKAKDAVRVFVDGMNTYAVNLGTCGSHFVSPDGYELESNYSTVEDMTIISKCAYENDIIMKYANMPFAEVVYASGQTNIWTNTNQMLIPESKYYNEDISGLKTGSLGKGNYNLICTLEHNGKKYIIGVFAAKSADTRFEDMQTLIDSLDVSV